MDIELEKRYGTMNGDVRNRRHRILANATRRRNSGSTLVDGLIATFVMVMLLLSLLSLMMASRVNAKVATENNAAYLAARQVIENVRLYRGTGLAIGVYPWERVRKLGKVPQIDNLSNADINMTIAQWKDPVTGVDRVPVKSVTVTVSWKALGGTNANKSRTLVCLVTPDGVVQ